MATARASLSLADAVQGFAAAPGPATAPPAAPSPRARPAAPAPSTGGAPAAPPQPAAEHPPQRLPSFAPVGTMPAAVQDLYRRLGIQRGREAFLGRFQLREEIGKGCFGRVVKATDWRSGQPVAVKLVGGPGTKATTLKSFLNECAVHMQASDHPNVTNFVGVWEYQPLMYALATEFVGGGELFQKIRTLGSFSEECAAGIARQLLRVLVYIHDKGIAHRDLKPENILFSCGAARRDGLDGEVKLIDFGFAKTKSLLADAADDPRFRTRLGSPNYVAPEILSSRRGYGVEVDVWSAGVILYIMLCGYFPFYHEDEAELYRQIKRGEFDMPSEDWVGISRPAKDLVKKMLRLDPLKRVTARECLQHPWLAQPGVASKWPLPVASRERLAAYVDGQEGLPRFQRAMHKFLAGFRKTDSPAAAPAGPGAGGPRPRKELPKSRLSKSFDEVAADTFERKGSFKVADVSMSADGAPGKAPLDRAPQKKAGCNCAVM